MRRKWTGILAALLTCLLLLSGWAETASSAGWNPGDGIRVQMTAKRKKKSKPTASPKVTEAVRTTPSPAEPVSEGPIIRPQAIADYLFAYGELPPNFITKREARELGWDSSWNDVSDVAPGMSIGGDFFVNYDGKLPVGKGIRYWEADCNYVSGRRRVERIVYSSDGRVWYTGDHYQTFQELFPSGTERKAGP